MILSWVDQEMISLRVAKAMMSLLAAKAKTKQRATAVQTFRLFRSQGHTKILDFILLKTKFKSPVDQKVQLEIVGGNIEIKQNGDLLGVVTNQTIADTILSSLIF